MNETTSSDVDFLYASIGVMFHNRQITNFSRPYALFTNQFKDFFFSFLKFKDFSRLALSSRLA